eukprot:scaffold170281_cov29-Tisochrysis_lutea.AAC.2
MATAAGRPRRGDSGVLEDSKAVRVEFEAEDARGEAGSGERRSCEQGRVYPEQVARKRAHRAQEERLGGRKGPRNKCRLPVPHTESGKPDHRADDRLRAREEEAEHKPCVRLSSRVVAAEHTQFGDNERRCRKQHSLRRPCQLERPA